MGTVSSLGVIGWYGQGNAGDDRILHCIRKALGNRGLLVMSSLEEAEARKAELDQCDAVVLGGGGLVLACTNRFADVISTLRPPLVSLGISVEATGAETEGLRMAIATKSELIVVRDHVSSVCFPGRNDVIVAPDLTFLDPLDVQPLTPGGPVTLNLRPWPTYPSVPVGRLTGRIRRMTHRWPVVSVRVGDSWRSEWIVTILRRSRLDIRPCPLCTNVHQDDRTELARFFANVPGAWSPELLRDTGWLLGMRLHSLVFACQSGLPFVGLDYQPKVREFARMLGLPDMAVPVYGLRGLHRALTRVREDYLSLRQQLLDYREKARDEVERAFRLVRQVIR